MWCFEADAAFSSLEKMLLNVLGLVALWLLWRWYRESKRVDDKGQKYVYVTGCDTGFGNLLAKHLDQLGFRVIAGCYTEKGEDELRKSASGKLTTVHLDVSDSQSVSKAADHIKTLVGPNGERFGPNDQSLAGRAVVGRELVVLLWLCCRRSLGCCEQCRNLGAVWADGLAHH